MKNKLLSVIGLFLLFFMIPSVASATEWPVYVIGGGSAIAQIMIGAAKLMTHPFFKSLLFTVALVGFLAAVLKAGFFWGTSFPSLIAYFLVLMFIFNTANNMPTDVVIIDKVAALRASDTCVVSGSSVTGNCGVNSGSKLALDKAGASAYGITYSVTYDNKNVFSNTGGDNAIIVKNIPALIAIPTSVISLAGENLASLLEQVLSIPTSLSMTKYDSSGTIELKPGMFNLAASMLLDSTRITITNPILRQNLTSYVQDCYITESAIIGETTSRLVTSPDVWKTLKVKNDAIFTKIQPTSTKSEVDAALKKAADLRTLAKTDADKDIATALEDAAKAYSATSFYKDVASTATSNSTVDAYDKTVQYFDDDFVPTKKLVDCASAYTILTHELTMFGAGSIAGASYDAMAKSGIFSSQAQAYVDTQRWVGNMSGANAPANAIYQTAMVNQMGGLFGEISAKVNGNTMSMNLAYAAQEQTHKNGWVMSAKFANQFMGYTLTAYQALLYALFPFLLVGAAIPGFAKKSAGNFLKLFVWISLIQPLLVVINFLVYTFGQSSVSNPISAAGGVTMENIGVISEMAANLSLIAGSLGALTPVIAWQATNGVLSLAEHASKLMGDALASTAASTAATGNHSLGNSQLNNNAFNKSNFASQTSVGSSGVEMFNGQAAFKENRQAGGLADSTALGTSAASDSLTNMSQHGSIVAKAGSNVIGTSNAQALKDASSLSTDANVANSGGNQGSSAIGYSLNNQNMRNEAANQAAGVAKSSGYASAKQMFTELSTQLGASLDLAVQQGKMTGQQAAELKKSPENAAAILGKTGLNKADQSIISNLAGATADAKALTKVSPGASTGLNVKGGVRNGDTISSDAKANELRQRISQQAMAAASGLTKSASKGSMYSNIGTISQKGSKSKTHENATSVRRDQQLSETGTNQDIANRTAANQLSIAGGRFGAEADTINNYLASNSNNWMSSMSNLISGEGSYKTESSLSGVIGAAQDNLSASVQNIQDASAQAIKDNSDKIHKGEQDVNSGINRVKAAAGALIGSGHAGVAGLLNTLGNKYNQDAQQAAYGIASESINNLNSAIALQYKSQTGKELDLNQLNDPAYRKEALSHLDPKTSFDLGNRVSVSAAQLQDPKALMNVANNLANNVLQDVRNNNGIDGGTVALKQQTGLNANDLTNVGGTAIALAATSLLGEKLASGVNKGNPIEGAPSKKSKGVKFPTTRRR